MSKRRPTLPESAPEAVLVDLDQACGRHLTLRDLIQAGETWHTRRPPPELLQPGTVSSLIRLAEQILDPVADEFGKIEITYGFGPPSLTRHIRGRIDPERDQHAGHELKGTGRCVCERLGQAADFKVQGGDMSAVTLFVARHLEFDRMYFYGDDRPLHVSVAPPERERARAIVAMLPGPSGKRLPKMVKEGWLADLVNNRARKA